MANRLQKIPRLVYTPGVAAVAARPPYCVTRQVVGSASGGLFGGFLSGGEGDVDAFGYQPTGATPEGWSGATSQGGQVNSYSAMRPVTRAVQQCYPGVPGRLAVPARLDQYDNLGWSAGGRTVDQVPDAGFFRCILPPSPVGVQVGLSGRLFQHAYAGMRHSLVARRGAFSIVESGSTVFGPGVLPASAAVEIRRQGGTVTYWVNDLMVYESAVPSSGEAYGGALLYSVVDYADSPQIGEAAIPVEFSARMPPLLAAISEVAGHNFMRGRLPGIHLDAELVPVKGVIRFAAELPQLVAAISSAAGINWMVSDMPRLGLHATLSTVEEMPSSMVAVLPNLILTSKLAQGNSVSFAAKVPLLIAAIATAPYNRVQAQLPLRLSANIGQPYMPDGETDGSDASFLNDTAQLETALLLLAMDFLDVSSTEASLTFILELSGFDSLEVSGDGSIGWVIELLAMEQVAIISRAQTARQQALQYAVNFMTGALTTYRDFDFLGFTYDDGDAYAWRKDGLYRIGGDGVGGSVINALVDFGATDYSDAHCKRMANAFVGVRSDGDCYLRLCVDDGPERVYKLIGEGPQKRAQLAKGVTGRTWNVRLELTEASYAQVDNVELEVGVSQRRSSGRRT